MTDVAFPDPLEVLVRAAFGADPDSNPLEWTWTDLSARVKTIDGISGRFGRQDEQAQIQSGAVQLTLDNETGDFTPDNPRSQYFPYVRRNVPIQIQPMLPDEIGNEITIVDDPFDRTLGSNWGQPDQGVRWYHEEVTGDSELVASVDGDRGVLQLVGSAEDGDGRSVMPTLFTDGDVVVTVQIPQVSTGAALHARIYYRGDSYYTVIVGFDTGGNVDLTLTADRPDNGNPSTILATLSNVLTYLASNEFHVRIHVDGADHKIRIWAAADPEPTTWDIEVTDTGEWRTGPVSLGIFRSFENTNTDPLLRFDDLTITTPIEPWSGSISEWAPEWPEGDLSEPGVDVQDQTDTRDRGYARTRISADGMLRRLMQGESVFSSAMVRAALDEPSVVAYWPMEDEDGATEFASPLPGVQPMNFTGEVDLAAARGPAGSLSLPSFKPRSRIIAPVPVTQGGTWTVACLFKLDEPVAASFRYGLDFRTSSPDFARWRVGLSDTQYHVQGFDTGGASASSITSSVDSYIFGRWLLITLSARQDDAATIQRQMNMIDAETGILLERSDEFPAGTDAGRVTSIDIGPMAATPDSREIGQVLVADGFSSTLDFEIALYGPGVVGVEGTPGFWREAVRGYVQERAGTRLVRLCAEQGIPFTLIGEAELTERMGAQDPLAFSRHLQEAEDLDGGILIENPWHSGLAYRARHTLEAQRERLAFDATPHQREPEITNPFRPILDDQDVGNDVTVTRQDGSSVRLEDPLHIVEHGRYDGPPGTVNAAWDSQLPSLAAWRLHLGTWPGMRYRSLTPALNRVPLLIPYWRGVQQGDRVTVVGLPPQHPEETVDLLLRGRSNKLEPESWDETAFTSPGGPWDIGQLSGNGLGDDTIPNRIDSSRSYLAENIDDAATSFDVITPVMCPLNPIPGFESEIVTVDSNVADPSEYRDYSYFGCLLERSRDQAFQGRWSGLITPDGVTNFPSIRTGRRPQVVSPDHDFQGSVWVWAVNAIRLVLTMRFSRSSVLTTSFSSGVIFVPAGAWKRIYVTGNPLNSGTFPGQTNAGSLDLAYFDALPADTDLVYADQFEIGTAGAHWIDDGSEYSALFPFEISVGSEHMLVTGITQVTDQVQTFTVTRDEQIPHFAGEQVQLAAPMRFSQGGGL